MPFRHGNTYRAFGWLVAVCLYFGPALAQQDVEKPAPTVNEGQGVAGEAPGPEEDSRESAEREQAPSADPLPAPPPVDNETETEPACDPRCEAAQQREKDDLGAQQDMARFAGDLVDLTFWQLLVGGTGIALLIGTLIYAARATNAAVAANRIARDNAKIELRAYIGISRIDTITATDIWDPSKTRKVLGYTIRPQISNSGATPAVDFKCFANHQIVRADNFVTPYFQKPLVDEEIMTTVGAKEKITGPARLVSYDDAQRVLERKARWFVWWRFEYRDVFDDTPLHHTEACCEIIVPGNPKIINPGDTLPEFSARIFGAQNHRS